MTKPKPLTDRAFIDWDDWLWDYDDYAKVPHLVSKDAQTWLAGYTAACGLPDNGGGKEGKGGKEKA